MEAELSANRRRRRVVVLAGLLLAVLAGAATYYLATRPSTGPGTAQERPVVIATTAIPARTVITAGMLRTEMVPDDPALNGVARDISQVTNNLARVDIAAGDLISRSMYGAGNAAGLAILEPGETIAPDSPIWRAVSVSVPPERAVGGQISNNDRVDLFVTLSPQLFDVSGGVPIPFPDVITDPDREGPLTLGYYSEQTTKVTWTNLQILFVDPVEQLYVLKVTESQAEEIAHVQATGASFTLGLRPPDDSREVDRTDYGQTTNGMIDDYGFPIPNMIEIPGEVPSPGPAVP